MSTDLEDRLKELRLSMASLKVANEKNQSGMVSAAGKPEEKPALVKNQKQVFLQRVMRVVQKYTGIALTLQHEEKLSRQLSKIVKATELNHWVSNFEMLGDKHKNWRQLIESLTVHETYFFRHHEQFKAVFDQAARQQVWSKSRPLRIWSAACSSGEEIYTFLLLLADMVQKEQVSKGELTRISALDLPFELLGTDLSNSVLDSARKGCYRNTELGAFRDGFPKALFRFFAQDRNQREECYCLDADLRKLVAFKQHNLLSGILPDTRSFDVVFCRNVMIYFDDASVTKVQALIHRSLNTNGVMVLGPTDRLMDSTLFVANKVGESVFYRKRPA
jgi:chemotaxis protein methyltransferase CheR